MRARAQRCLVRGVAVGACALLVLHLLRSHVAERYLVPTQSMEPTLHGDPRHGDVVLVDKAGLVRPHDLASLHRFDTVVVRDEDAEFEHLVKRAVSLGDEEVAIRDGDLFVRSLGTAQPFRRVQKHPQEYRDMRLAWFRWPDPAGADVSEYLTWGATQQGVIAVPLAGPDVDAVAAPYRVEAARRARDASPRDWRPPAAMLRTTVPIDVSFLDAEGRRIALGRGFDADVGIEATIAVDGGFTGLGFALEHRERLIVLTYGADGLGRLDVEGQEVAVRGPACGGESVRVEFGHLDGRVFLIVDGQLALLHELSPPRQGRDDWPENMVHLGVAGSGGPAQVRAVQVFRDVHYRPDLVAFAEPVYRVEPGQVFLLGDNSSYSVDSRRRGAFAAATLTGRPLAVIGPAARVRWLPR